MIVIEAAPRILAQCGGKGASASASLSSVSSSSCSSGSDASRPIGVGTGTGTPAALQIRDPPRMKKSFSSSTRSSTTMRSARAVPLITTTTTRVFLYYSFLLSLLLPVSLVRAQERQYSRFGGTMDLSPIADGSDLSAAAILEWETRTASFYVTALEGRTDLDPPISDPEVSISLLFAARPGDDATGSVLAMQYRATASFITTATDYDPGFLALPAFREEAAVLAYVVGLRQSGNSIFENLSSLSLTVQAATPVAAPTPAPVSPTTAPVATPPPTPRPTTAATPSPTRFPTLAPVVDATPEPTRTPSSPFPTIRTPTFSLTAAPANTSGATPSPTAEDTADDTEVTTLAPTSGKEDNTTEGPASPPTTPPPTTPTTPTSGPPTGTGLQNKYATTSLIFNTVPGIMPQTPILERWRTITTAYIREYIQTLESTLIVHDSDLAIEKVLQNELEQFITTIEDPDAAVAAPTTTSAGTTNDSIRRSRRAALRALQDEETTNATDTTATANMINITIVSLSVEFVTKVALPSTYDASSLVNGAFSTRSRRSLYRVYILEEIQNIEDGEEAQALQDFFDGSILTDVLYDADGSNPNENDDTTDPSTGNEDAPPDKNNMGVIIGGAVGGLLVVLLVVYAVYKMNNNDKSSTKDLTSSDGGNGSHTRDLSPGSNNMMIKGNSSMPTNGTSNMAAGGPHGSNGLTWEPAEQPSRLNQEIVVPEGGDDVSTIGEPWMYGQQNGQEEDEQTATTSVLQTETYNSLLGRPRIQHENSFTRSTADQTEFSAFTGMSKYLAPPYNTPSKQGKGLLGELGVNTMGGDDNDDTSFEQRLFPMDAMEEHASLEREEEERSLDYSLPTALM